MADEPRSVTTHDLLAMKERGERIVVLTCYDALFARLLDAAGVDLLLVGDSVNQVLAGAETTLSATLEQMIYHTKIVRRGAARAMVVCDMPFLTYQVSAHEAIRNCGRVMQETDCHGVKLEGGARWRKRCGPSWTSGYPSWATWVSPPSRCTRWAATACKDATRKPPSDSRPMPRRWSRRAPLPSSWSSSPRRSHPRSPSPSRSPPSASARGQPATARCWCSPTCWG